MPPNANASAGACFSVMAWNVAEFKPSATAPPGWTRWASMAAVAQAVLAEQPTVLALQEVPTDVPAPELEGYRKVDADAASHCGRVCVYADDRRVAVVGQRADGPHVIVWALVDGERVAFVAGHLAPGAAAAPVRARQIRSACEAAARNAPLGHAHRTVWVGDANAREAETAALCGAAGLTDMFERWAATAAAADAERVRQSKFTWDSVRNKFHASGHPFRCRFDRCMASADLSCADWRLVRGEMAAEGSPPFCLSDHFGLVAHIRL